MPKKSLMGRTEKDWLDWLMVTAPGLIHQPIMLKKQYPKQYQRIIQIVGNWMTVEDKIKRYRAGKYQPAEVLSEELKAIKCEAVAKQEGSECDKKAKRKRAGKNSVPAVKLLSVKKIDENFKMPEPNPRYARTKYSEIYNAKPYSVMPSQSPKLRTKKAVAGKPAAKEEVVLEKPQRKKAYVSDAEIREFVIEAMRTLGETPSWDEYRAYVKEHGGVGAIKLSRRGFGLLKWPEIAEEERVKLSEKTARSLEVLPG